MRIIFRNAKESDFSRIGEIATKGWLFTYSYLPAGKLKELVNKYYSEKSLKGSLERVREGTDSFIVAQLNKKVIGFCHVTSKVKGELLRLYLEPKYIGKGIGKKLLVKGEKFLKSKKCKKYFTFVNQAARNPPL